MKNFIANIPIYIGALLKIASDKLFNLSFKLHITFKTDAGLKLIEINKAFKDVQQAFVSAQNSQKTVKQDPNSPDKKLVNILNGVNNERPIFTPTKKPTTDN